MPLISSERPRPPSEQLVDLHVYVVPPSAWNEQYRSVFNQAVNETISAGFVRAHPEDPLYKLREDLDEQLGNDIIPEEYVFLRSVGRCFTQVKGKQEVNVKVKHFLPPYNFSAEIFVLKYRREHVPLPEINGNKEHSLERKYSRTEGTQTTQSANSGYHSDDWPSSHVKPTSTENSLVHRSADKSPKKSIGQPKKVPIKKGPKGISKKGAIALGSSMQQNGKISGKQFREVTNRRPEKKGLATTRVIGKVSESGKVGMKTERVQVICSGRGRVIGGGRGRGVISEGMNRSRLKPGVRTNIEGGRVAGVGRQAGSNNLEAVRKPGIGRQNEVASLDEDKKQAMMIQARQRIGTTAPHSSHQPSNKGDHNLSSPPDTYSSFSPSGQHPLPPIQTRHFLPTPPKSNSPVPLHLNHSLKQIKSPDDDLTSRSQDSLPRFLSPEQNDHAFPKQEGEDRTSQAPASNIEHRPPLSATPPDSPLFTIHPAYLTNQMEIAEHVKPGDKPGWRDTYTNGTNEDSGIAEPTPEEGDSDFSQHPHTSIERHEVINHHPGNGQMMVVDHSHEEPHRTEQRRRYNEDDFTQSNESKKIQDFQSRFDQFLEDEENRKELENLEQMREQNAQNMADVREKREAMELMMARRAQELAREDSHGSKPYQIDPSERSSLASKEVSRYGDMMALGKNEQGHLIDEQRDLDPEQWSGSQAPAALSEKELLHQFQKDEADKNRRALEAIKIEEDSNSKEHSFLKKGNKRGIPSAIKEPFQDTPVLTVAVPGKTTRSAQLTNQAIKNKNCNQLLADLEEMREQRRAIEQRREDLVRKAKTLQTRTVEKRNKARDYWKKQYFEAKKLTNPQEETINKLRQQVEQAHRKLMVMMEGRAQAKKMPPSQKNNHKINIAKGQHDLEDLRRRVENAKMRLTSEMKLRNQAEKELRTLKNELTQKKIHVTLTRSQQLAILKESEEGLLSSRTPYETPLPRRTPLATNQLRQSMTSLP